MQTGDSYIPGLTGRVLVRFADNLWSGETQIDYNREDPNLSGSILVRVRQTEEGVLVISGEGDLTAGLFEGVEGTAGVVIDEEGKVVVNFAITQTTPYELFPERRQEREFLNISQNIPLFAGIVVAVIRIRAGVRAGVGPGQMRNSTITGTWEVTSEEPPDLTVSSEFYMPAFVEGYVAFGAGLGVDVVLGLVLLLCLGGIGVVCRIGNGFIEAKVWKWYRPTAPWAVDIRIIPVIPDGILTNSSLAVVILILLLSASRGTSAVAVLASLLGPGSLLF